MWFQQWIQDCRWLLGPTLTLIVFDKDNLCKEELNIGSKKEYYDEEQEKNHTFIILAQQGQGGADC